MMVVIRSLTEYTTLLTSKAWLGPGGAPVGESVEPDVRTGPDRTERTGFHHHGELDSL